MLPSRVCSQRLGGEPLWRAPEDLVIFFLVRGRPSTLLNKRLPGMFRRVIGLSAH